MHDFTLFLLERWLPVGLSAIVFFAIGLLMAKFIWGRYNQRLSFAVEENLNLASQWSSLGASQRDLFKKLRSRWQADRVAWEARISENETELATRDARIEQLTAHLKGTGKHLPAPVEIDRGSEMRIEQLEARLNGKEREIELLKAEAKETTSPGEIFARAQVTEETMDDESEEEPITLTTEQTAELRCRIQELEQDLIDTRDQFQSVREAYEKQSCLVESQKSQLIELLDEGEISALNLKLEQANRSAMEAARCNKQLATLLRWKHRETTTLKGANEKLQVTAREAEILRGALVETTENLEARDRELAEANQKIEATNSKLEKVNHTATKAARVREQLAALLRWKNRETVTMKRAIEKLQVTAREAETIREALIKTTESEIASKTATIDSLESEVAKLTEAVSVIEPLEQSKAALQAKLNDACHEMHDVRTALNDRMGEFELLEARLDQLGKAEEERARLDAALLESSHDFANLQLRFEETQNDLKVSTGQIEELEAIIEDRSAEIDDLSAEVRQQRDMIQEQKHTLAWKEGELEAASGQVSTLSVKVTSNEKTLKNKAKRIEDLERALTERYEELNSLRMEYDEELKSAHYHVARAKQLEAELERRAAAFEEANLRAVTSEEALERADQQIGELTAKLGEEDESITNLKREIEELSEEKQEHVSNIKKARERVGKLELAVQNRELELEAIGDELKQIKARAAADNRANAESIERLTSKHADLINHLILENESAMAELKRESETEISVLKNKGETEISRLKGETRDLNRRIAVLGTELAAAKEKQAASQASITELESSLRASDERTLALSKNIDNKERELVALNDDLIASKKQAANRKEELVKVKQAATKTQVELDAKLEKIIKDKETVVASHEGTLAERFKEIEELRAKLAAQELSTECFKKLRSQSIEEVDKFRKKLAKQGETIRELQAEISNVMLQRSSRDGEIAHLKEKLRAVEHEFRSTDGTQSLAAVDTANINSIEGLVQTPLHPQAIKKEEGVSLDEIENPIESDNPDNPDNPDNQRKAPAESPNEQLEPEAGPSVTNDDSIFFDESSSDLTDSGLNAIDQFARVLRGSNRNLTVAVVGYAGPEGSPDYTELLSARRADAVRERLLERGVPQSIISVKGSGLDRRCNNWRARRVELLQMASPEAEAVN